MKPLTVDDILNIKEPADRVHMSLSSDGKWIAFCLNGSEKSEKSLGVSQAVDGNVQWVCNIKTRKAYRIAPKAKSSWAGVWSPDSTSLAFFADTGGKAQVWLWSPSDESLKLASEDIVRPFFGFEKPIWTRDSRNIIVKSLPSEEVDDTYFSSSILSVNDRIKKSNTKPQFFTTNISTKNEDDAANSSWVNRYRADITMINILSGKNRTLCSGFNPVGMAISNDGKYFAFTSCLGEERQNTQQNIFDLMVTPIDIDNGTKPRCIAKNVRMDYGLSFSWARDDQSVIYTTCGPLSEGGLWSVNLISSVPKLLFSRENMHLGREFDGPISLPNKDILFIVNGCLSRYSHINGNVEELITIEGRKIVAILPITNPTDKNVIVQTRETTHVIDGFWKVNLVTNETEKLLEEPRAHIPWFEGGVAYRKYEDSELIVYIAQAANEPPTLWSIDVKSKTKTPQLIFESTKINTNELGESQLIFWNQGNRRLKGALLLPKNRQGPVPVIMRVYGGFMQSNKVRLFGLSNSIADNHQLFASRGYAVFLPDLPMSGSHEPADEITTAIENAVIALVQHPEINPEKIGIIGHSFGGYSALVAITRLQRFKAAVISSGIGNLISMYTKLDFNNLNVNYGWVEDGQANMGATLWENKERYIRNSPLFDFQNIQVPVLIVQGTRDHICEAEAGPIFSSLNRLGKEAKLVLYDEEHWQGTWGKENLQDYYDQVFNLFDKHLLNK